MVINATKANPESVLSIFQAKIREHYKNNEDISPVALDFICGIFEDFYKHSNIFRNSCYEQITPEQLSKIEGSGSRLELVIRNFETFFDSCEVNHGLDGKEKLNLGDISYSFTKETVNYNPPENPPFPNLSFE